jgi:UDP-3-O-[3-hydroxymyristoyl] glucosamine N-acyltransferase
MSDEAVLPGDPRFFGPRVARSLGEVADAAGAVVAEEQRGRIVAGVAPLQIAGAAHVSFLDNRRYADQLANSAAGVVILRPDLAARAPAGCITLTTAEPYLAWARVAALFHPLPPAKPGVHPTAVVDPSASVDPSCEIGPYVIIGAEAEIGARCRLDAFVSVGAGVRLGTDCRIGAHVALSHALIGARVALSPGVKIGQEGFGFATGPAGFETVPQLGRVVIGDDVEVGANTAIDRGSLHDTVIGAGSRLDNLVQIGHNVRLGRCCVIVGQAGISGSAVLEDFVVLAGQSGIAGHLRIGRGAKIGARSGVMNDMPAGQDWVGAPAMPVREFFRQVATLKRLAARPARKTEAE